jgi:hypothetical protein
LRTFAAESGTPMNGPDALMTLATFIAANKVALILGEVLTRENERSTSALSLKLSRTVARFVSQRCLASAELSKALEALTEGLVLKDALMLSDLADLGARFHRLTVALDTPVLLAALDLAGVANGIAAREFISLSQHAGAKLIVFAPTRSEVRGILSMYENHLGTAQGRLSLFRNEVTQHVLAAKLAPSDMRALSALFDRRLTELGIAIQDTPPRVPAYTMNENALAEALMDPRDLDPDRPRIRHDVDCVAGILTLRGGRSDTSLDRCVAVFCSSTTQVVRNVQRWYSDQGGRGVPPMVHIVALSSIAWLKRPASAKGFMLHELSAYCSAILRPKRATWEAFTTTLRKLREDGSLSDDEAVAIVASDLTEPLLSQLDDEYEPDSDTILDAIERVRKSYQQNAENAAVMAIARARSEVQLAEEDAASANRQTFHIKSVIERRAGVIGTSIANLFYGTIIFAYLASAILSVPGVFESIPKPIRFAARVLLLVTSVFVVVSWRKGTSLNDYRVAVRNALAAWIRARIFGIVD